MTVTWYCAETKPYQMERARDELLRQGFGVCFPIYKKRTITRRKVKTTDHPMFPGYLPVSFNEDTDRWMAINSTPGVKRLMCYVEDEVVYPKRVPTKIMNDLLARMAEGPIYDLSKLQIFKRGQTLRIVDSKSALFGWTGHCDYSDKNRVEIWLSIFGRVTKARLTPQQVELA